MSTTKTYKQGRGIFDFDKLTNERNLVRRIVLPKMIKIALHSNLNQPEINWIHHGNFTLSAAIVHASDGIFSSMLR